MLRTDDTIVEVFEWAVGAVERVRTGYAVLAQLRRCAACDIVPLATLPEPATMFASSPTHHSLAKQSLLYPIRNSHDGLFRRQ
jgi:hypothetical protein